MLYFGLRRLSASQALSPYAVPASALGVPPAPGSYPVRLDGHLDPTTSRWLWLVKWVLVIPHVVVLRFRGWRSSCSPWSQASPSCLRGGTQTIFDFNAGVMRWTWRVSFYAIGAFATDRYPPFSLAPDPTFPADLTIDYPDHLSRGLVLVKWWLLALPQYVIVAFFAGGWGFGSTARSWRCRCRSDRRTGPRGRSGLGGTWSVPRVHLRFRHGHEPVVLPGARLCRSDRGRVSALPA